MTLDEAIAHEKELAKEIYIEAMLCHANPDDGKLDDCIERGKYHEHIVVWLEELKSYIVSVFSGDMTQKMLKEEYCNAVDDFAKKFIVLSDDGEFMTRLSEFPATTILELAERLKVGEQNE